MFLDFDHQKGKEQKGRRPALVLSPREYNKIVGLAIMCPITSQIKGYAFEVLIENNPKIQGVVLTDQVRSLDWKIRRTSYIGKLKKETFDEVVGKLSVLIF